ncbi:hypothetical protein [Streptomyces sp. NPDC059894]|uniref:hypothetical protein n=1 Tax=unclassified Streptomyces TaxID=2593676 RepID=UPI003666BD89
MTDRRYEVFYRTNKIDPPADPYLDEPVAGRYAYNLIHSFGNHVPAKATLRRQNRDLAAVRENYHAPATPDGAFGRQSDFPSFGGYSFPTLSQGADRRRRGRVSGPLARKCPGTVGQRWDTSGRNREQGRISTHLLVVCLEGRLTGKCPGQAPFQRLEEAQLLRRVRHQEVLRLLVVHGSDAA